jgi:hypothetical protein
VQGLLGVLWVLEGNSRARGFYERQRWEADGQTTTATYDGLELVAVRYGKGLQASGDMAPNSS